MEMINFSNNSTNVMPTLVGLLSNCKYSFETIADGFHTHFYCMIKCNERASSRFYKFFKWAGIGKTMEKYELFPLSMCYYDCSNHYHSVPMVFTQEDVKAVIEAVPQNYIGSDTL